MGVRGIFTRRRSKPDRDPPARVAEREVASAIVHGGTPIRPLYRGWVRGGRVAEGSRSSFQRKQKRGATPLCLALRPSCCLRVAIYMAGVRTLVTYVTKSSLVLVPVRIDLREVRPLFRNEILRKDGLYRARGLAGSTIDANLRIDVEHRVLRETCLILSRMNAVDRTNLNAGGVFGSDARLSNHICHFCVFLATADII